ncbi:cytochrome-c peroxidase [Flammeovirga sp. EKP202]|uniref:cytochrome-c peroxidase n=1 Tax=Flammeovirga sp. EKP202 TaxID=2770592 RepID=UPI00165FADC0|nr:cytochrome c peroxidase [Flammeovirga sp. EKP202]MBD0402457.1 c-type cytochrome [Flammeovirga sp. EKP202]
MRKVLYFLSLTAVLTSCSEGNKKTEQKLEKATAEEWKIASSMFGVLPTEAINEENPSNESKIQLGKMLYFDTRLSKDGNISCNSCHDLATFGVDNKATSPGDTGEFGDRNSPTVINSALQFVQFWDGRAKDVEEQAIGPILNPIEHAMPNEKEVINRLSEVAEYVKLFKEAFPNEKQPLTYKNVGNAIGSFERTLLFPSRFDRFLAQESNSYLLTAKEAQGLRDFQEAGCVTCHSGNMLGGNMYQKFGVYGNYWEMTGSKKQDEGRKEVTGQENDKYHFKVPTLRNIAKTAPYFHDGSVEKLEDAVKIMAKLQSNVEITDEQASNISAFLGTLTSKIPEEVTQAPTLP